MRRRTVFLTCMAASIVITGCTTRSYYDPSAVDSPAAMAGYVPLGTVEGYFDTQMSVNVFRVGFQGDWNVPSSSVQELALLRAAEVCSEAGFRFFVITDTESSPERRVKAAATSFGQTAVGRAREEIRVRIQYTVHGLSDASWNPAGTVYDCAIVTRSVRHKYGL